MQAGFTLVVVIVTQTLSMFLWIVWRERDELPRIARTWKPSLAVGFVGATASFGWFTAMTLQQAAVVKALAQVEMLLPSPRPCFSSKRRSTGWKFPAAC